MSEALLSAASMPSDSSSENSGFGVLRVTVGNGTYEVDENVKSAIILNTLSKISDYSHRGDPNITSFIGSYSSTPDPLFVNFGSSVTTACAGVVFFTNHASTSGTSLYYYDWCSVTIKLNEDGITVSSGTLDLSGVGSTYINLLLLPYTLTSYNT